MAYLDASRVNSFPSTKRASVNKLMTENSVTRLINRLIDVDGFVITTGLNDIDFTHDIPIDMWGNTVSSGTVSDFEFVIRGYYFSIAAQGTVSGLAYLLNTTGFDYQSSEETEHTLYAGIFIDKTDPDFPELYGQNDSGEYKAISFYIDSDIPTADPNLGEGNYKFYSLPLVKYKQQENGKWGRVVPLTSLYKFSSASISNIDGGEIDLNRE